MLGKDIKKKEEEGMKIKRNLKQPAEGESVTQPAAIVYPQIKQHRSGFVT